jgi:hypothetical protein
MAVPAAAPHSDAHRNSATKLQQLLEQGSGDSLWKVAEVDLAIDELLIRLSKEVVKRKFGVRSDGVKAPIDKRA